MRIMAAAAILAWALGGAPGQVRAAAGPVWPPPPAQARVAWVGEIPCAELEKDRSLLGGIGRFLLGGSEGETLALPFDLLVDGDRFYMTCQEFPALVMVEPGRKKYTLFSCEDRPLVSPVAVAGDGRTVYVSDSGQGAVYRLEDDRLEPWVTAGLIRPTGLACSEDGRRVYVVDTGDHSLKIFDAQGRLVGAPQARGEADAGLNFPTFAVATGQDIWVNDTLNYRMKRLDGAGKLLGAFGEEGGGPGTFARPKGLAVGPGGNIWVVDALFDNVQIFDPAGRLLLVVGGRGQGPGEFWSPTGIAIDGDLVYVADTFNNRVQILRCIGGGS